MVNEKKNIDMYRLLKLIAADRKKTVAYCLAGAIFGTIIAFSIPKIYKTGAMLAPESSGSGLGSGLSSMASLVGLNKNILSGDDAIFPEIYPDLMQSTDFVVSLFPVKVKSADGKINTTYYDYMEKYQKIPWWKYPQAWVAALIKKMKAGNGKGSAKIDPFRLTKDQADIASGISGNIECNVDKKTSVISIVVTDQDPLISATIADSVKARLQVFITRYRTNKARNDLAYMERLFEETKNDYVKARRRYAEFSDSNQEVILQTIKAKEEELENEMQLRFNIYTQVTEQLQLAKAKVQEKTPAFTVVQSATVPVKHSNRPKIFTLAIYTILAFFIRVSMLVYRNRDTIF